MDRKFPFTVAALNAVTCPDGRDRAYAYDARTPGLAYCLTAGGRRSFYVYRRVHGRPERIRLGGFPELSIEQARGRAAEVGGDIARGLDPQQAKRARRAEATVGGLFTHYLESHAKQHKKTWEDDQAQFDRYLDGWRNRRLSAVRKADVQALHAKVGVDHGKYAANRLLSLLHAMFGKAADLGFDKANPAHGVRKFKEKSRERFLQADELPKFFKALDAEANETVRDYVWLSLLTGARRSNVQAMAWADVNLARAVWVIPDTKSGDPVTVALVPRAVEILTERRKQKADSPFVFPGYGKSGHLVEPKAAWAAILKRAGLTDLRLHDLRRTLGSWQAAGGASLTLIGKSLGHKNPATTAIYARLNLDPVRESVGAAAAAMLAAGGAAPAKRMEQ